MSLEDRNDRRQSILLFKCRIMDNHSFNINVAVKIGIEKAILMQNIAFWIERNKANEVNFYD